MAWYALLHWAKDKEYRGWDFLFYAAMQQNTGDVNRSFKGFHLGRMSQPSMVVTCDQGESP